MQGISIGAIITSDLNINRHERSTQAPGPCDRVLLFCNTNVTHPVEQLMWNNGTNNGTVLGSIEHMF